jgi:type VI secretion system protein ImpL
MPVSSLYSTYLLIGLIAVALCTVVVLVVRWRELRSRKRTTSPESTPGGSATPPIGTPGATAVDEVFQEANNRLRFAPRMKGASVASLPVFLIVGPHGAGKTNVMVHSGLDPELLAGQVYQGAEITPTATLNIWLVRQVIFIEIPASLATDANTLKAIIKHLAPRGIGLALGKDQPPRGFLLCTNPTPIADAATPGEISALARPWNECLSRVAGALGVQLPLYVLFTKMDGVPGFAEFVANFGPRERAQAVGAATRPYNPAAGGAYAEQTARVINQHFSEVAYALCDGRVPLMRREQNRARLAAGYQFPREFQKLQKNLVQFLVEVSRPSQLQVSAFLRGFYFCGTRKVAVDRPGEQAVRAAAQPVGYGALNATTVLSPEQIRKQMAAAQVAEPLQAGREITEWLFVASVIESVLLRDRPAHSVSSTSSRTDRARAVAFAVLGVLGLVLAAALTISYVYNRRLEKELVSAARKLADRSGAGSSWKRLEQMRQAVEPLVKYRSKTPLHMTWGLYSGSELLPPARKIYCSEMRSQVLQLVRNMESDLATIRNPGVDPLSAFNVLKAYMMMTTSPEHADGSFLAEQLFETWKRTPAAASETEADQLLPEQLRLYGSLLAVPDVQGPCQFTAIPGMIDSAQDYLRGINFDYHYQSLLALAGKGIDPVNYNQRYPNVAVQDDYTVKSWFTQQGWTKMQDALDHPSVSLKADDWVLGSESREFTAVELEKKARDYGSRYRTEYEKSWKKYLELARIEPYSNSTDAAAKLDLMAGQYKYLLKLVGLAAEHTGSIKEMKESFEPATEVATDTEKFPTAVNDYLDKLKRLKNRLPGADMPSVQDVYDAAVDSTEKLADPFQGDLAPVVKRILLEPIMNIKGLLEKQNKDAVNAALKKLCGDANLYPLHEKARPASFDQIQTLFDRQTGEMWTLQKSLGDSLDCSGYKCGEKPNPKTKLRPGFLSFFNGLNIWSRLLESGGQLGMIQLSLRAKPFNGLKTLSLKIGDKTPQTLQAGGEPVWIIWDARSPHNFILDGVFDAGEAPVLFSPDVPGPWALFEWIFDSEVGSGGSDGFRWVPRSGAKTQQHFSNNRTKEYKIEIRGPDERPLDRRSLAVGPCALPLAN